MITASDVLIRNARKLISKKALEYIDSIFEDIDSMSKESLFSGLVLNSNELIKKTEEDDYDYFIEIFILSGYYPYYLDGGKILISTTRRIDIEQNRK